MYQFIGVAFVYLFAKKINVSERTIYNYLEFMKVELQAPIVYNGSKKSYCYDGECGLKFKAV